MKNFKIAIFYSGNGPTHSGNWTGPWVEYCKRHSLVYQIVDPTDLNIIQKAKTFDVCLWHFSGYNYTEMQLAPSILHSLEHIGKLVFPNFNDSWHFDDKIAQMYLLQNIDAPIPQSYVFYSNSNIQDFVRGNPEFPLIAKLKNGSGSHNVKMIQSSKQLFDYSKTMFSKGFSSSPSLIYKSTSNIRSAKSLKTMVNRAKRIPEFLRTRRKALQFPKEKGYVYLQEFIPNDGFDLKVVVVGDKLSFIGRSTRKGEFRASGGGSLFYDKKFISKELISVAFEVSDRLGVQCMGYDFVIDNRNNKPIIIEMSYGFSHSALLDAQGYFDRKGNWHNEPLNAPEEVLQNLIKKRAQT
ncbi:MAG: hypothetical protein CMC08_01960 [Flavobacteriaceae bacterium]|nr:hypothetical protein [Flavobacteriaceae bacterium]